MVDWKSIRSGDTKHTNTFNIPPPPQGMFYAKLRILLLALTVVCLVCTFLDVGADVSLWVFLFIAASWSSIAASETDVNSPLNQTLMDKIRGNLDWLRVFNSMSLFECTGRFYDAVVPAWIWRMNITRTIGSTNPENELFVISANADDTKIYIPPGITTVRFHLYCYTDFSGVNVCFRCYVGANSTDVCSVGAAVNWQTCDVTIPGTGWQNMRVSGVNKNTGNPKTYYLFGLVVRPLN